MHLLYCFLFTLCWRLGVKHYEEVYFLFSPCLWKLIKELGRIFRDFSVFLTLCSLHKAQQFIEFRQAKDVSLSTIIVKSSDFREAKIHEPQAFHLASQACVSKTMCSTNPYLSWHPSLHSGPRALWTWVAHRKHFQRLMVDKRHTQISPLCRKR